jgi:cytochrome c oxidase cbb3-type subunit 4
VNSLAEHFETDWQAMTAADWVGTILTVVIFVLMVVAYFQVFRPKNRDKLESRKHIPFDVDNEDIGDKDGGH